MSRKFVNSGLVAVGLIVAFLFMASIFVPKSIEAGEPPESVAHSSAERGSLPLLGQLESQQFTVRIYGSPSRPLYSVYDRNGRELASLLEPEQVAARFPELPLPDATTLRSMDASVRPDW
jgi:hypothetical protein